MCPSVVGDKYSCSKLVVQFINKHKKYASYKYQPKRNIGRNYSQSTMYQSHVVQTITITPSPTDKRPWDIRPSDNTSIVCSLACELAATWRWPTLAQMNHSELSP